MSQTQIVEYSHQFAKAVADMWNASGEGWNGRVFNSSEARVCQEESSTRYLNLYLSVEGERVMGYAKLTDYTEEPGVAYIELLNVIPIHHGKGIGRDLVKRCVLRAAELGYERLDLFTWSGNTKAVPLYKKCGFFWEKMENNSTHLMNFIPGLLNLAILKPWWDVFDWYEDCRRVLDTEPDGRDEHGFDIYDYIWEKDGRRLEISYERGGRGIVGIRTQDFQMAISTEQPKPVFGIPRKLHYSLSNLSGKALDIRLDGINDAGISHSFQHSGLLESSLELESDYLPNPLDKAVSEWETSPRVRCMLTLDGHVLPMAIGLRVQYPLTATLRNVDSLLQPGLWYKMYLNLESHFDCECYFEIKLSEHEHICLREREFSFTSEAEGRRWLELEFSCDQALIYNPKIRVEATPEGGSVLDFCLNPSLILHQPLGRHGSENPDASFMVNSLNSYRSYKEGSKNFAWVGRLFCNGISLMCPQPGKPYSEELESALPYQTLFNQGPDYIETENRFRSKDIPGLEFALIYRLRDSGLVEVFPRCLALPEDRDEIWFKLPFNIYEGRLSFWFDGRIVETDRELLDFGSCDLPRACPQENWLFSETDDASIGLIWSDDTRLTPDRYWLAWEVDLKALAAKGLDAPQPLQIHLDVFKNAWQLRNLARGRVQTQPISSGVELRVNQGDPVLRLPCRAELIQNLDMELKAAYSLESSCVSNPAVLDSPVNEDGIRRLGWDLTQAPDQPLELVKVSVKMPYTDFERSQLLLHPRGESSYREDAQSLSFDNGEITITAARDARLPGLISLKHKGLEYLDSAYPDYAAKGFYKPFPGGLSLTPPDVSKRKQMEEFHTVEAASLTDQFGTLWQGLALSTRVEQFGPQKGLVFRQLYLALPGVPVLMLLAEISDWGGRRQYYNFNLSLYRQLGHNRGEDGYLLGHKDGRQQRIHCSDTESYASAWLDTVAITSPQNPSHLQFQTLGSIWAAITQDPCMSVIQLRLHTCVSDPLPQRTAPLFMIFSPRIYQKQELGQLLGLKL